MKTFFNMSEGKDRSLLRRLKREFHEDQVNKLPNELRGAFTNYNHRSVAEFWHIDENEYDYK